MLVMVTYPLSYTYHANKAERQDPVTSFQDSCVEATITWSGLQACASANACALTDQEMLDLFKARKEAIVYCAAAAAQKAFMEAETDKDVQPSPMTEEREQQWQSTDQTS